MKTIKRKFDCAEEIILMVFFLTRRLVAPLLSDEDASESDAGGNSPCMLHRTDAVLKS